LPTVILPHDVLPEGVRFTLNRTGRIHGTPAILPEDTITILFFLKGKLLKASHEHPSTVLLRHDRLRLAEKPGQVLKVSGSEKYETLLKTATAGTLGAKKSQRSFHAYSYNNLNRTLMIPHRRKKNPPYPAISVGTKDLCMGSEGFEPSKA
jgi:hypothetical protein